MPKAAVQKSPAPKKVVPSPKPILFYADANDPDMLYFSRFRAFDPYLAFFHKGKKIGVSYTLEYQRMVTESDFDEVVLLKEIQLDAAKRFDVADHRKTTVTQQVLQFAKRHGIDEFRVSSKFPAGLAFELNAAGLKISPEADGQLFPERVIKTASEIESLRKGNAASTAGFKAVRKALAESKIKGDTLIHQGRVLTSERLRELIGIAALENGAIALHTIVAGGDQGCDCHHAGSGPIRPNELIVVDIFPRRIEDGYWGDMTRTFLKGKASDAQKKLVRTVKKAHGMALEMIKPGLAAGEVHNAIQAFFDKEGYVTERDCAEPKGFFHGLGHCIGLEVHELPFMGSLSGWKFKPGMAITVEPGLYYKGIGGVRIEDMIHVTPDGNEQISKDSYKWEIP